VLTIRENVALAPLTTLQVGGPARYFVAAVSEDEVWGAVDFSRTNNLPLLVLGGGSNVVVADAGWPGLVLKIAIPGVLERENDSAGAVLFNAGAGLDWDQFVAQTVASDCAGLECLSGIPGTVGATPVQNIGAYGQEVSQTIESVRAIDLENSKVILLSNEACAFGYRSSVFNTSARGRFIILQVSYRLRRGAAPDLKYADLQRYFADSRQAPSLEQVRTAVREIRKSKGMLIVPGASDCRSAGSFFKNPVLGATQFSNLVCRAASQGLKIPSYPALDAQHKVSAAWLVEHSGFSKGFTLGAAGIAEKHALALINRGNARATDIVKLKDMIQREVERYWGITLEPEPVFVGF
jgi:UDP-N-acetylmuramate dehydrogenase